MKITRNDGHPNANIIIECIRSIVTIGGRRPSEYSHIFAGIKARSHGLARFFPPNLNSMIMYITLEETSVCLNEITILVVLLKLCKYIFVVSERWFLCFNFSLCLGTLYTSLSVMSIGLDINLQSKWLKLHLRYILMLLSQTYVSS